MKKYLFLLLILSSVCLSCTRAEYDPFVTIKGTVVDDSTGTALPSVGVAITPSVSNSKETNDDGQYEFVELEAGRYTVRVWMAGYQANSKTVEAISGKTQIVDFRLEKER